MSSALVSLKDVSVRIGSASVLSGLNFNIAKGGHVAVVGASGAGKSTLLRLLAGLHGVSAGKISYHFDGMLTDRPALHKMVFVDSRHHFKNLSNTTDLYYQQRFNSSDADDAPTVADHLAELAAVVLPGYWNIERVTNRFALNDFADKELIKLSNGETKRLRLASAFLKNPELLLLDQPFTGLDVGARAHLNKLLDELASHGCTVVIATAPTEIPSIITKVITLRDGKVSAITDPAIYQQHYLANDHIINRINTDEITALLEKDYTGYTTFIKMQNVNVRYGEKQILKEINWEVRQGERWALLGPNGAGKSTLLSLIYGDNPQAYANNIVLFDKKRGTGESIWDIKKRCGFVSPELFQYFPPDNNCLQVVESGFYDTLGLFKQSEQSRAALAIRWMKLLEIERYANQPLKNIPASEQRLCLLARALVKNPDLLIFDEPCQGLDEHQKNKFKNIIDTICVPSNLTLIYVTHYLEELPNAVNKYLKLQGGEVAEW